MVQPQRVFQRLEAIAHSLAQTGHGLALLGLGSVGTELDRLERYSDLDFDEARVVWQRDGFDATTVRAPAP